VTLTLTLEEQMKLNEYLSKWRSIFMDTSPLNMEELHYAANLYLKKLGRGPVNQIKVYKSPVSALTATKLHILNQYHQEHTITWKDCQDSGVNNVTKQEFEYYYPLLVMEEETFFKGKEDIHLLDKEDQFRWKVLNKWLKDNNESYVTGYGNHTGPWLGYIEFFKDCMGYKKDLETLEPYLAIARAANWFWVVDNNLFVSERPTEFHLDENDELSNREGPAVAWGDEFSYYSIDGVRVPADIIEEPGSPTLDRINDTHNAEVKRIMVELYTGGMAKYLEDSRAKLIDIDTIPVNSWDTSRVYTRALFDINTDNPILVATDGSTGRVYYLNVDRGVTTCRQAHNSISPISEEFILASS
jgi:hypothetical protein